MQFLLPLRGALYKVDLTIPLRHLTLNNTHVYYILLCYSFSSTLVHIAQSSMFQLRLMLMVILILILIQHSTILVVPGPGAFGVTLQLLELYYRFVVVGSTSYKRKLALSKYQIFVGRNLGLGLGYTNENQILSLQLIGIREVSKLMNLDLGRELDLSLGGKTFQHFCCQKWVVAY